MSNTKYKETEYSKKLRDPRWQKKRLEIMQRDDFHCQNCFDSESTLNVHHCYYGPRKEPWDYPNKSLVTLCQTCHEHETETASGFKSDLIAMFCQLGFLASHFEALCTGISRTNYITHPDIDASIIQFFLEDEEAWHLVADLYAKHIRKIAEIIRNNEKKA